MDLRRIRHFVVLAETLNFGRAAERLHMAQPPLSVSIQKLETELGTKLFIRTSRGVQLTAGGTAALLEAKRLLYHGNQLNQIARAAENGTGGQLHIGFAGSAIYGLLPTLVPQFRADYPGVEMILREATSARIIQSLEENSLDIGLVRTPLLKSTSATLVTLQHDRFIAALPYGNPLADRATLTLPDMAGESFVMYTRTDAAGLHGAAMLACQQSGFLPRVTQEATQIQTVLALVASGLGVALVPSIMEQFRGERIVYRELSKLPPAANTTLALAYRADMESPAAQRFRELATRTVVP